MNIEINSEIPVKEWRAYVENHPEGIIYHLHQWKEVLEESFHHKPFYLFAKDEEDKLCGLLPLFQVNSWLTGNRLVSLPFSLCGPIADSQAVLRELVQKAKILCDELKCRYLEIRMAESKDLGLLTSDYFSTYILRLSKLQTVWKKIDTKSVRWAINRARKDGVTINTSSTLEDVKRFYQLNQMTKRRIGVPGHPHIFLKNICSVMDAYTKLYLAEFERLPIGGIITHSFKDTVSYAYAASDPKFMRYHPNELLLWKAIEDSYSNGYGYFDFGKTSPDNEGLGRFKKHWGTEKNKLYYYYYPRIPKLISANRSGIKYRLITSLWRRLPLCFIQTLSLIAFRHLD